MLKVSKTSSLTDLVSVDNPISTQHPNTGSSEIVELWLFNADSTKYHTDITVSSPGTKNWCELSADGTTYEETINLANIVDATGHKFYAKFTTPKVEGSQKNTDIVINITSKENAK